MTRRTMIEGFLGVAVVIAALAACSNSGQVTPKPSEPTTYSAAPMATEEQSPETYCSVFDMGNELPQFRIIIDTPSGDTVNVGSLTVIGSDGQSEYGSTTVDINQVILGGQSQEYWINLPQGWYTDVTHPGAEQDTYSAIPTSCQILGNV
jgi:hypothetical protein